MYGKIHQNTRLPVVCMYLPSRLENSVDPDQLASLKPADLDLDCFKT